MLRLAAVLNNEVDRHSICVFTDYPIRLVPLDDNSNHTFGGVVDYILATYYAERECELIHKSYLVVLCLAFGNPAQLQSSPDEALKAPGFRKLGSTNIFQMQSVAELKHGLPQCILTTASWCRQCG